MYSRRPNQSIYLGTQDDCTLEMGSSLKGYLCYKTITSQNVPSEVQITNIFVS